MGTMTFGAGAEEAECGRMYGMCRDAGINLFDTADVYAKGEGERILGRLVRGHRDEVVLCTKAYFQTGTGPNGQGLGRKHLLQAIDRSLTRLGTDYIDVFYLHKFDLGTPLLEALETVDLLVRRGKVLYVGLSNFSAWQIELAIRLSQSHGLTGITCIQPMYNLLKRQCESEILPVAEYEGLGVISYSPVAAGYLSGKYASFADSAIGRIAADNMYRRRYANDNYSTVAKSFADYAASHDVHPVALAIAWVSSHPAITAPLIGARNCEQLRPALEAASVKLTTAAREEISALSVAPPIATDRTEEA